MHVRIELLGEPSFTVDGKPWRFGAPPKALPLLTLLVLRREPIGRATLAALLWPDDAESESRANLRRHIHALTRALPALDGDTWILSSGQTVAWNHAAPATIDVVEFERAASDSATYDRAVALYRGDLASSLFDEALFGERERIRNIHLSVLYDLAQQARAARDFSKSALLAEAILAMDEWREDALRLLMTVRYASGDRSGALAAFERFAHRLREELRTEPMFETSALRDAIVNDTLAPDVPAAAASTTFARPLIGRDEILEQLQHAWVRAANGSGSTVFLAGEAGIGKSHLAQELLATIETQGGRTAVGHTSQPESVPYQPLIEVLRQLVPFVRPSERDQRWLSTLAPLVPEVQRLYTWVDEAPSLEGSRGQLRLQEAMLRAIEASSRVRPVAILLEDLHLANTGTLDMIAGIAERLSGIPAILLLTYRSTEAGADSALRALRRSLQRSSRATHISLPRLGARDVERMIELAAPDARALAQRVYELSEGNPLFIWQLLHQAAEGQGSLDVAAAIASVGDAIRARLSFLPENVRAVADVAAIVGDTFTVEEISAIGGWDEAVVFSALATLLDRQIVAERAGASFEYGFTHALIGTAIYDATAEAVRTSRHRRAAATLETTRAQAGTSHLLVAQHWERAGEPENARAAYLAAARAALASYARAEARDLAQRVLYTGSSGTQRFAALQILIAATDRAGEVETAQRAVEELDELADALGAAEQYEAFVTRIRFHEHHSQREAQQRAIDRLAAFAADHENDQWAIEATLRRATLALQRGGTAESERILLELGAVERIEEPKQRYRYYAQLAQSLIRQGRYDEGKAHLRAFRTYLQTHPSVEGESLYAGAEHKYAWLLEDADYGKRTATRIIELAQARGDLIDEANGRLDLAYLTHQVQDTSGARTQFERAMEIFARCQSWQGWVNARINYGVMEREVGHLDRARAYWNEGRSKAADLGMRFALTVSDLNLAEVALLEDDPETALACAQAAYDLSEESGERHLLAETHVTLGAALCRNGEPVRGLRLFESGIALSRSMQRPRMLAAHLTTYLEELTRSGKPRVSSHIVASELFELFDSDPLDHQHPGRISWTLASYLRATGRDAEAERLLHRAGEILEGRLAKFTDAADRDAFRSVLPNAWIFEWYSKGRTGATSRL